MPTGRLTSRDYKKPVRRPLDLARWREFGAGLLAGLVLAVVGFAYTHRGHHVPQDTPRPEPRRTPAQDAGTGDAATGSERYDFYQMLPNFEVVVPEKERDVKRDLPTAQIERPGVYVLQAGSYRNEADADRVSKQLALQGIAAKVQRVAVDNDVWHRVRIGPISDLAMLNRVRKQLQAADVDAIVIRVGD